ncbi:RNA polymerase sigma factor [Nannocystaceae bacterium ST9]
MEPAESEIEHDAGELDRLVRFMTRPGRRFGLALATYASEAVAAEKRAIAETRSRDSGVRVGTATFADLASDVIGNLAAKSQALDVLFVIGIDPIAYDAEQDSIETRLMLSLNVRRDELPDRVDARIVFWLISEGYPQMAVLAWDLLVVMNTRFEFLEAREVAPEVPVDVPIRPSWMVPLGEVDPAVIIRQAESLVAVSDTSSEEARAEVAASAGRLWASIDRFDEAIQWIGLAAKLFEQIGANDPSHILSAAIQFRRIAEIARLCGRTDLADESARKSIALLDRVGVHSSSRITSEQVRAASLLGEDPFPTESDEALLIRWKNGDRRAGNALYRRGFPSVRNYFRSRVPEAAEDLVQATFTRLSRFVQDTPSSQLENFRAILTGISASILRRHFRKPIRSDFIKSSDSETIYIDSLSAVDLDPDIISLNSAIGHLDDDDQLLLEFTYRYSMSPSELATALGIPEPTARHKLQSAIRRLAKVFRPHARDLDETCRTVEFLLETIRHQHMLRQNQSHD